MAVMTTRFVSAAELMARVLGFPGYEFAVIAHPISSAGDAEPARHGRRRDCPGAPVAAGELNGSCLCYRAAVPYPFRPPLRRSIISRSLLSCISMLKLGMLSNPRPLGRPVSGSATTLP